MPWAVASGAFLFPVSFEKRRGPLMADPSSPIEFEDIPLDEARRMSCGPRMDPERYHALKENIQFRDFCPTPPKGGIRITRFALTRNRFRRDSDRR